MTDIEGLDVLVLGPDEKVTGHETGEHPAALWTKQVLATENIRALVRNIDERTPFDDVHRTAEKVAEHLGVGAAEVAFAGPDIEIAVGQS